MSQSGYNRALGLLSARAYTVRDLRRKLLGKEVDSAEVDRVVGRLLEAGLLDDARYAASFARARLAGAGTSGRRIRQELIRKGVAADIAEAAVERVIADEEIDTGAVLERVARKKLASMGDLDPVVTRRRLFAYLARRGYDLDEIRRAIDRR